MSVKYNSPKGIAHYPALVKADTRFNPEGTYKTGLIVSEEHIEELKETCKEVFTEEFGKKKAWNTAQVPYKTLEVEGEEDQYVVNLSSKNKPKFFDAKGNPILNTSVIEKLGGGSKLRLKGSIAAYNAGGKVGVKIYLNEVQVISYVEYNGGGFQADDEEEDGFVAGKAAASAPAEEFRDTSDDDTDSDDIPF